jgi:hypothetical protein
LWQSSLHSLQVFLLGVVKHFSDNVLVFILPASPMQLLPAHFQDFRAKLLGNTVSAGKKITHLSYFEKNRNFMVV